MGEPGVINEWLNSVKVTCLMNRILLGRSKLRAASGREGRKERNKYFCDRIAVDHRLAIASATRPETKGKIARLLAWALPSVNTTRR